MKIYRDLLILVLLFIGVWLGAGYYFSGKENTNIQVIGEEKKEILAEYLDRELKAKGEFHNSLVDSSLNVILDRLKLNQNTYSKYNLTILESEDINAFATLNGNIYVNTGLIRKCDSPEMLASVLAHEMGHNNEEHLVERLVNELGLSLMLSILTGGDPVMVSELSKTAVQMHFSREQEREADAFAREVLLKSQIDPVRFAQFMMVIKREQGSVPVFTFLNTHPEVEERIISTSEFQKPDDFEEKEFNLPWDKVIEALRAEK